MSKTSISILQEAIMKLSGCSLPIYVEVSSGIGIQKRFTIQVTWKSYSAKGVGFSKKEAKQNAAKEMILLLSSKNILQSTLSLLPTEEFIPNSIASMSIDRPNLQNSMSLLDSDASPHASSSQSTFVNYVGLLQEYSVTRNLLSPSYTLLNISGPSHIPGFTIQCKVASVSKEATETTKKAAKQKAAKEVLQHFIGNTHTLDTDMDKLNIEYMDLRIDEAKSDKLKNENALEIYNKTKNRPFRANNQTEVNDFHDALSNHCKNITHSNKIVLMSVVRMKKCYLDNITDMKNIIQDALKVTLEKISFQAKNNHYIVGLRLTTTPPMMQIGLNNTPDQAEKEALHKLFELVIAFLK
ncbi:Interferon-inducible double stranded RNA-dependent protein kinase activator A like protein A [Dufourea novaeangliae]|uniref:Interferon-inducible double stranded RNA-dependent protein kinase activator A like protein A n=1 Tax=Dufourea novaeangliae TaxID=178035 RepID=A0A154PFB2_DUFNO|nr:Interferon-inducible double stranded RNA-dependent protein kinase activator A like protein A [Dufourea novaeangliae]